MDGCQFAPREALSRHSSDEPRTRPFLIHAYCSDICHCWREQYLDRPHTSRIYHHSPGRACNERVRCNIASSAPHVIDAYARPSPQDNPHARLFFYEHDHPYVLPPLRVASLLLPHPEEERRRDGSWYEPRNSRDERNNALRDHVQERQRV